MIRNQRLQLIRTLSESLANSKTSKSADSIISKYGLRIQRIADQIIRDGKPLEISRMEYGKRITQLYLEVSQKVMILSLSYIEKSTGIYPILTTKHIQKIHDEAQKNTERFWRMIQNRETTVQESFSLPQILSQLISSLAGSVFGSLNSNTIDTMKSLDSNLNPLDDSPVRTRPFRMMWITEDDQKVCPICFPLHGHIYDINDEIPQIPRDTHPNCRCRVVPVDGEGNPIID